MNKTIKKILAITAIALIAMPLFYSCKKGENDPFISLRSRDKRITGEWKLVSAEETSTWSRDFGFGATSGSTTTIYDGKTSVTTGGGSSLYTLTITFEKDGTATYKEDDDGDIEDVTDEWFWLDSKKNKTTISHPFGFFVVDQLKNKELILKDSGTNNQSGSGWYDNNSWEETWTFEKQK
ncbi:MAG: hypothetical protein FVQ77_00255 [Cytophagales bacterium]|nr:hypothetical protein [Cytophagales bacterium]